MTILSKNLARFTTLMVALSLLFGLMVTGCSDDNRYHAMSDGLLNISYRFAQSAPVATKTAENAETVVITAYDAKGRALDVEQDTEIITEHKDVTPIGVVGTTVWEGNARIDRRAKKVVLDYYDSYGGSIGTPDVFDDVEMEEGTNIDFTIDDGVNEAIWNYDEDAYTLHVGQVMTIGAKNGVDDTLTVKLHIDGDKVITDGADVIAVTPTAEGETVEINASATDAQGKTIGTKTYTITVVPATVIWNPAESEKELRLGDKFKFTAEVDGELQNVTLESSTPDIISVTGDEVLCQELTGAEPIEVVATAVTGQGIVLEKKNYLFTVVPETITWDPAVTDFVMDLGSIKVFSAYGASSCPLDVSISTRSSAFKKLNDCTLKAIEESSSPYGNEVVASAFKNGIFVGENRYIVRVRVAYVTWDPDYDTQHIYVGQSMTIVAKGDGFNYKVRLSSESDCVSFDGAVITGVKQTSLGNIAFVVAQAIDESGMVIKEMHYYFSVL